MKKIKLITTLTSLGAVASTVPAVVTGCTSDGKNSVVLGFTQYAQVTNGFFSYGHPGTFAVDALTGDETATIVLTIGGTEKGKLTYSVKANDKVVSGASIQDGKLVISASAIPASTTLWTISATSDNSDDEITPVTINITKAPVRCVAEAKLGSSKSTEIFNGYQLSQALATGDTIKVKLMNYDDTTNGTDNIVWASTAKTAVGGFVGTTDGKTEVTWQAAGTARVNQQIMILAFNKADLTNPIGIFSFYNAGSTESFWRKVKTDTGISTTYDSNVWTFTANPGASQNSSISFTYSSSGFTATYEATITKWDGYEFVTDVLNTSSSVPVLATITTPTNGIKVTYAASTNVENGFIVINGEKTQYGRTSGANVFLKVVKTD